METNGHGHLSLERWHRARRTISNKVKREGREIWTRFEPGIGTGIRDQEAKGGAGKGKRENKNEENWITILFTSRFGTTFWISPTHNPTDGISNTQSQKSFALDELRNK